MVKKNAPPEDAETKPAHPRHYRGSMDTQREREWVAFLRSQQQSP